MPSLDKLRNYAMVVVRLGVGIEEGDRLIITAPIDSLAFTRLLVAEAYRAGAANVDVLWDDDEITRSRFSEGGDLAHSAITGHSKVFDVAVETGDFALKVLAEDPHLLSGFAPSAVARFRTVNNEQTRAFDVRRRKFITQWAVASASVPSWATTVFPDLPPAEAVEALWGAIFRACRIDEADPRHAWEAHLDELGARARHLNECRYTSLRYVGTGTDLTLGLPPNHVWHGGAIHSTAGRRFVPNLPTEEVFTAPHRLVGDGVVSCTKPAVINGNIVSDIVLTIDGGRVVSGSAGQGQAMLDEVLATDEGASHLGEIALVPQSSSVAREELVWNNALYDENDACHLALGQSYAINIDGGSDMSEPELDASGMNQSSLHIDLVVGSAQLSIFGIKSDGSEEPVLLEGEWAFET